MKLFATYGSVDNCAKGVPALKACVVHMKSQSLVVFKHRPFEFFA